MLLCVYVNVIMMTDIINETGENRCLTMSCQIPAMQLNLLIKVLCLLENEFEYLLNLSAYLRWSFNVDI